MTNGTNCDGSDPSNPAPVGYGSPPMKRRFKGSGNPNGRPNGARNRKTIVRAVASETYAVMEDGKKVRRSTLDLVRIRLQNMALEGRNEKPFDELHRMLQKLDPKRTGPEPGVLVAPAEISTEEWIARAERTNALMEKHGVRNIADAQRLEREEQQRLRDEAAKLKDRPLDPGADDSYPG